jgi:hypothetical protein
LVSRLVVALPVLPTCAAISMTLSAEPGIGVLAAVGGALVGFTPVWFFTGAGQATRALLFGTLMRLVPQVIGLLLTSVVASVIPYLFGVGIGNVASVFFASIVIGVGRRTGGHAWRRSFHRSLGVIRAQLAASITAITTSVYVALPIPIVSFFQPGMAGEFAAGQSLIVFITTLVRPVVQVLQGTVPSRNKTVSVRKVRLAGRFAYVLVALYGTLAGASLLLLLPALSGYAMTWSEAVPVALVTGSIAGSQIVGLVCLTVLGRVSSLMQSTIVGAVVGLTTLPLGTIAFGTSGAWGCLALAELSVLIYQSLAVRRDLRARDQSSAFG